MSKVRLRKRQGGNGGRRRGGGPNRGKGPTQPWWAPPKTERGAMRQAFKETRPEYLPVKRQLRGEMKASNRRVGEIGSWFDAYLKEVAGGQAATQQAYADAATQTGGMLSQASAVDSANTQRLNQEASQSAALRGQTAPTAEFTGRANAAQAQRNYLGAAMGGVNAQRGANQYAYLTEQKRIGAGQKVKSMMDERSRGRSIAKDLLAAKKEQGAQASKNLRENREGVREYMLKVRAFTDPEPYDEALKEQSRLNYKGDVASSRAQERAAELYAGAEHDTADATRESANTYSKGKGGKQKREAKEARQNAWVTAKSLFEKGPKGKGSVWASWAALETRLRRESEITPKDAHWAVKELKKKVQKEEAVNRAADKVKPSW